MRKILVSAQQLPWHSIQRLVSTEHTTELRRDQEQGGGAGPSQQDGLSCCRVVSQQLLFGHCLCDFVQHSW